MILKIYLFKKFLKALLICAGLSYSIFFLFSLIGNLGEKLSFKLILYLSALNSLQIFTYIPSHLFILSFCVFIINLNSKNELIIVKEYFKLKSLFFIIFPILTIFSFTEIQKDTFSKNIEKIKSNLISSKKSEETKILISSDGNKKKYIIFNGFNETNSFVKQYLNFEMQDQNIYKGEISTNLNLSENNLYSFESTIYENNNFRQERIKKKIFENFVNYWSKNTGMIVKTKANNSGVNFNFIQSIFFYSLFYICISMIFLSKNLINRNLNTTKVFLIVLSIFLYHLIIPKIILNNFQHVFQTISIVIFLLIFLNTRHYE